MSDKPTWTIRQILLLIACLAPLLALARYPFAFGFVVTAGSIALFIGWCFKRRRFDAIAWLICLYPALPLANLYLSWKMLKLRYIRRDSMALLDGMFGISDIGALICLLAYVGCVFILFSGSDPALRRAAKRVVILMPLIWGLFFAFAVWDPFGVMGYMFRF